MEFELSNQAVGAIMMLLQKAILSTISESSDVDVVETLKGFKLASTEEGLVVKNPPVVFVSSVNDALYVDPDADTVEIDS
jgi:exosome complex RNA-binding protein Rrp42 (RNase PH superfamily)